ncbi:MAG: PSD1 and planctomycete cytochrome C domain-containing protein [Planctomycetaceae bacterium]
MPRKPDRFRRVFRLSGVVLLAAGVGSWLWAPRIRLSSVFERFTIAKPVVPNFTPSALVAGTPVDARDVCRELARRYEGSGPQPAAVREVTASLQSHAEMTDNGWDPSAVFAREIRPLLAGHCYPCHGPDRQEAGIRFDRRETVFRMTKSGTVPVMAGDPAHSELLARVTSADDAVRMPPGALPLVPEQIEQLNQWITAGADWPEDETHWSFVKPRAVLPPHHSQVAWTRNTIDDFVAARLEAAGISSTPEADRTTLIRRLSLDLIGLPPTPEEVDEFEADRRPDAYERLVDRLLASPHFGEKWAIRWLDLARFADTNGFEFDAERTMWLYRDWVIDALNGDMPFDQFTVEQLAGDLLPGAAVSQQVATGFLRNSPVATDTLTYRFDMLVDRINTLGATWLGLTLSCAQCHDHKFDPLTQQEYYQLYAILNNVADEVIGLAYAGSSLRATSPLTGESATTLVLEERTEPIVTHLKVRGSPVVDGDPVAPALPGFLHPPRCGQSDRLALACWLVDENNPLTARVTVNRVWESLYGVGLVRTSDDFGVRGEPPSHPELLDWLAVEFEQSGWSTKHIIRQIVTSATYRQSSHRSQESQERDPQNRLLAHGPRFRVDAELLRDLSLAVSGLLCTKLGGPSVFPWQPPGTSENIEFASFAWKVSEGEDRYRRGLYTHWKRRTLYPSFTLFDAPNRMSSCTRRERTTNPLQALVALNDPVFIESAVQLGRRMLDETDGSSSAAITRGFRLCVGRQPTAPELSLLQTLYDAEYKRLKEDAGAALALIGGEAALARLPERDLSAWAACSTVANTLLSLDETITRE